MSTATEIPGISSKRWYIYQTPNPLSLLTGFILFKSRWQKVIRVPFTCRKRNLPFYSRIPVSFWLSSDRSLLSKILCISGRLAAETITVRTHEAHYAYDSYRLLFNWPNSKFTYIKFFFKSSLLGVHCIFNVNFSCSQVLIQMQNV